MNKHSNLPLIAMGKLLMKHYRYPWIAQKLLALQGDKIFFPLQEALRQPWTGGKIRQVSIRITDLCNLRCIMCGQWGDSGFLREADMGALKRQEVTPERYIEVLDDLVDNGHKPQVYFWGGEPLMYNGLFDLIEHAYSLGLPSAIATNGTLLHKFADDIARVPMYLLQVSIDGHCSEVHNRIRRAVSDSDCFQKTMDGIDAVRAARERMGKGMPLIASLTTVSKDNHANLVDIYHAMKDKVDFLVFYPAWWIDEESCEAHSLDYERRFGEKPELHRGWVGGWTPDDFETLNEQFSQLRRLGAKLGKPPVIILPDVGGQDALKRYYTDHNETFGYNRCMSIHQVVEINSNGDLSPCRDYHDYVVGNIKDSTITEMWNSSRFKAFRKSLGEDGLMPVCSRCCGLMGY